MGTTATNSPLQSGMAWLLLLFGLLLGCSEEDDIAPAGGTVGAGGGGSAGCEVPNRLLDDGTCLAPGYQPNGCRAGEVLDAGGGCAAAGSFAEGCADGFELAAGDEGCRPIVPAAACPPGQLGAVGDRDCRPLGDCGSGSWGNIPQASGTIYVDASYSGGNSDGSQQSPFTTVAAGVAATSSGGVVAIAAGSYGETVVLSDAITLWGVCPADVSLTGSGNLAAVRINASAAGAAIRGLAIRGGAPAVLIDGATGVTLDTLWLDGSVSSGLVARGGASVSGSELLLDGCGDVGVVADSAEVILNGSVVRSSVVGALNQAGFGVAANRSSATSARASIELSTSVIRGNRNAGVLSIGSDVLMRRSVVVDTLPDAGGGFGRGVQAQALMGSDGASDVTIEDSYLANNREANVSLVGSRGTIVRSALRDAVAGPGNTDGYGVFVGISSGLAGEAIIEDSRVDGYDAAGVFVLEGTLTMSGSAVRDRGGPDGPEWGIAVSLRGSATAEHPSRGTIVASRVSDAELFGILAQRAELTLDGVAVSDIAPHQDAFGIAVAVQTDKEVGSSASGSISNSWFERSHLSGFFSAGATVELLGVAVSEIMGAPATGPIARGMIIQDDVVSGPSVATLSYSAVQGGTDVGIFVGGSQANIDGVLVSGVQSHSDGVAGDGIVFIRRVDTSGAVSSSVLRDNARAGLVSFGAGVSVADTTLICNDIDLAVEESDGVPGAMADGGGNSCSCGDAVRDCQALSAGLTPPEALGP